MSFTSLREKKKNKAEKYQHQILLHRIVNISEITTNLSWEYTPDTNSKHVPENIRSQKTGNMNIMKKHLSQFMKLENTFIHGESRDYFPVNECK